MGACFTIVGRNGRTGAGSESGCGAAALGSAVVLEPRHDVFHRCCRGCSMCPRKESAGVPFCRKEDCSERGVMLVHYADKVSAALRVTFVADPLRLREFQAIVCGWCCQFDH